MIERFFRWADLHEVAGEWVAWSVFIREFHKYLKSRKLDPADWPQERIERALGPSMPIGRGARNIKVVGNVSDRFRQPRRLVKDAAGVIRLEFPHLKVAS